MPFANLCICHLDRPYFDVRAANIQCYIDMRKGIRSGIYFLLVLWGLSVFFETAFTALDSAARESFETIEAAAVRSQIELNSI